MQDSPITKMIAELSGPELIDALASHSYAKPAATPDITTPGGYLEVGDAGVGYEPGTWDEVEYAATTGVLDQPTYNAAYAKWLGSAEAPADGEQAPEGESKRLAFVAPRS